MWTVDGSSEPIELKGHESSIRTAEFSPDGSRILTASKDGTARIWSIFEDPVVLPEHVDGARRVELTSDGTRALTLSWDGTARLWMVDGNEDPVIIGPSESMYGFNSAALSPDGSRVATSSDEATEIWSFDEEEDPLQFWGRYQSADIYGNVHSHWGPKGSDVVAFSLDGRMVACAYGFTVSVWPVDRPENPLELGPHEGAVEGLEFSPDGTLIVAFSSREARIWRTDGGGDPVVLDGHEPKLYSARFNRRGTHIVTASANSTATVWPVNGSDDPIVLGGNVGDVNSAAFNSDGSRVAIASLDGIARIYDADGSGEPVNLAASTYANPLIAEFSPDDTKVLVASADGSVRLWRADGSDRPLVLKGHVDRVETIDFNADGTRVITGSRDGTARVWTLDGKDLQKRLRTAMTACLEPSFRIATLVELPETAWSQYAACELDHKRCPDASGLFDPRDSKEAESFLSKLTDEDRERYERCKTERMMEAQPVPWPPSQQLSEESAR